MNSTTQNHPPFIVFCIQVPGLQMQGLTCFLVSRLLQESIDRALSKVGLLADMPELAVIQNALMATVDEIIQKNAAMAESLATSFLDVEEKEKALSNHRQTADIASRISSDRPLSIVAQSNQFYGTFHVKDIKLSLVALESELKRIAFLEWSEIGYRDTEDNVFRIYFPKNSNRHFDARVLGYLKAHGLL